MSGPVDVLAAWDRQIEWLDDLAATNQGDDQHAQELEEAKRARAALAELMDKADSVLVLGFTGTGRRELRAALARCRGEA